MPDLGNGPVAGRRRDALGRSRIRDLGVAVIPEDRQREGLLLERPVSENFLLGLQRSSAFSQTGLLNSKNLRAAATQAVEEYDVRPRDLAIFPAGNLSGGNQQKLIVAPNFRGNRVC